MLAVVAKTHNPPWVQNSSTGHKNFSLDPKDASLLHLRSCLLWSPCEIAGALPGTPWFSMSWPTLCVQVLRLWLAPCIVLSQVGSSDKVRELCFGWHAQIRWHGAEILKGWRNSVSAYLYEAEKTDPETVWGKVFPRALQQSDNELSHLEIRTLSTVPVVHTS